MNTVMFDMSPLRRTCDPDCLKPHVASCSESIAPISKRILPSCAANSPGHSGINFVEKWEIQFWLIFPVYRVVDFRNNLRFQGMLSRASRLAHLEVERFRNGFHHLGQHVCRVIPVPTLLEYEQFTFWLIFPVYRVICFSRLLHCLYPMVSAV